MISYSESSIYILGRSTTRKRRIIARDFNVNNPLLTHIAIGLYQQQELRIYNITNIISNPEDSALRIETVYDFINLEDIEYFGIWEIPLNKVEINKIKSALSKLITKKIVFNDDFKFNNGDHLYCSEFVYLMIKEIESLNLDNSMIVKKKLNSFYSRALKRDYLEYIPVDFFINIKGIKLIFQKSW